MVTLYSLTHSSSLSYVAWLVASVSVLMSMTYIWCWHDQFCLYYDLCIPV